MSQPIDLDTLRELELLSAIPPEQRKALAQSAEKTVAVASAPTPAPARSNAMRPRAESASPAPAPQPAPQDPVRTARIAGLAWPELIAEIAGCTACRLCEKRKQAVPGVGAPDAPWLFVGEGPGADEDEAGEPFVGQAGKLLDAMLAAAGLLRGREVYIANVVKCRPPGNRTPGADEAAACAAFLDRQIDLIRPKIIVALGKTAVTRLTGRDSSMASLRQQVFDYRGVPVVATYHPAYLLRNLPDKLKAWEDLLFARKAFQRGMAPT
jgi:uracil-DNA glycosylase